MADSGKAMLTEQISARYEDLDSWSSADMIAAMYEGQLAAAASVQGALDSIAAAVDAAVPALQRGGRIVYAGAGTSGPGLSGGGCGAGVSAADWSPVGLPVAGWPAGTGSAGC